MIVKEMKIVLKSEHEGDLMNLAESKDAEGEPIQIFFDGKIAMVQPFADDARGNEGTFEDLFTDMLESDENVVSYFVFEHQD